MSLDPVKRAAKRRAAATRDLRAAIIQAREDGHSLRAIGQAALLSHVRVLKILRGD